MHVANAFGIIAPHVVVEPTVRRGRSAWWLAASWSLFGLSAVGVLSTALPLALHLLVATAALVVLMVVAHDAIHFAAHADVKMNVRVGWLASLACGVPFPMLANNHLRHHRLVDTAQDPERFCLGPAWQLLVRWPAMLGFYYLDTWPRLQARARVQAVAYLVSVVVLVTAAPVLLVLWVLPLLFAATLFACFTVWLPHGPLGAFVMKVAPGLTGFHDDHHARPAFPAHQYGQLNRWHRQQGVVTRQLPVVSDSVERATEAGHLLAARVLEAAGQTTHAIDLAPLVERTVATLTASRLGVVLSQVRRGARFSSLRLELEAARVAMVTGQAPAAVKARLTDGRDVVVLKTLERLSRHPVIGAKVESELAAERSELLGAVVKETARLHRVPGLPMASQAFRHPQAFDPSRFHGDLRRSEFELEVIALVAPVLRAARVNVRSGFVGGQGKGLDVRVQARA